MKYISLAILFILLSSSFPASADYYWTDSGMIGSKPPAEVLIHNPNPSYNWQR